MNVDYKELFSNYPEYVILAAAIAYVVISGWGDFSRSIEISRRARKSGEKNLQLSYSSRPLRNQRGGCL